MHERTSNTCQNLIKIKKIPCKDQACVLLAVLIMKTQVGKLKSKGDPHGMGVQLCFASVLAVLQVY